MFMQQHDYNLPINLFCLFFLQKNKESDVHSVPFSNLHKDDTNEKKELTIDNAVSSETAVRLLDAEKAELQCLNETTK